MFPVAVQLQASFWSLHVCDLCSPTTAAASCSWAWSCCQTCGFQAGLVREHSGLNRATKGKENGKVPALPPFKNLVPKFCVLWKCPPYPDNPSLCHSSTAGLHLPPLSCSGRECRVLPASILLAILRQTPCQVSSCRISTRGRGSVVMQSLTWLPGQSDTAALVYLPGEVNLSLAASARRQTNLSCVASIPPPLAFPVPPPSVNPPLPVV